MQTNVGNIDRIFCVVLGLVLLSLIFLVDSNLRWFGLIGLVPILTAVVGWCPAYALVGINTCPTKQE